MSIEIEAQTVMLTRNSGYIDDGIMGGCQSLASEKVSSGQKVLTETGETGEFLLKKSRPGCTGRSEFAAFGRVIVFHAYSDDMNYCRVFVFFQACSGGQTLQVIHVLWRTRIGRGTAQ